MLNIKCSVHGMGKVFVVCLCLRLRYGSSDGSVTCYRQSINSPFPSFSSSSEATCNRKPEAATTYASASSRASSAFRFDSACVCVCVCVCVCKRGGEGGAGEFLCLSVCVTGKDREKKGGVKKSKGVVKVRVHQRNVVRQERMII